MTLRNLRMPVALVPLVVLAWAATFFLGPAWFLYTRIGYAVVHGLLVAASRLLGS